MHTKISATIIVKNEETNIQDCLNSLDFVDEIVVVDSGSSDGTEKICRACPKVKFFTHTWEGFGKQKNIAASLAENDWILNLDADERVTPELRNSILDANFERFAAFRMARENYFGKRWIRRCGWYPDAKVRLYNRRQTAFSEKVVHEGVVEPENTGYLDGNLKHFTYSGISDYVARMDRYSSLAAEEMIKKKRKYCISTVLLRPVWTFFRMYFLRGGFLEGYTGLLLSLLYTQYTFLKYAKARELIEIGKK